MHDMDHRQLASFVAVADAGSFTRAARLAGTTQPTVSATIHRLERELGVSLFVRGTRPLSLSKAGAAFLPHAREVLAALEEARATVTDASAEPVGEVRLGMLGFSRGLDVVSFIAGFRRDHPGVMPRLVSRAPEDLILDVRDGRLDLALTMTLEQESPPAGVEFAILQTEPFQLLVGPDHPLAACERVTVD